MNERQARIDEVFARLKRERDADARERSNSADHLVEAISKLPEQSRKALLKGLRITEQ